MATQSLYRRYRPRKFSELKGQDHIVRALRDAVASGREGQAYLFSGPRGTGKTTTARILAKVLNCNNVVEGEPCCECESCVAVERGTSYDVHELDAASNNGVDAIRDLVEKSALGTPGRHKVYILDEVHMLSKAAEAALLKTLEEPPPHVVFVLATTDPQKMSDTIRSRTQHLQFHLLPADVLADHIKWVANDAGYDLSQAAIDAALTQGGGSARDTLSALELLASTGGDVSDVVKLDEFLEALVERDPGRALAAMGHEVGLGHDPRTVTEDLIRHLRDAFLTIMAPELVLLPSDRIDTLASQAQLMGAASLVRAIERLGSTLVDMRHAPDPRILVEVALVQLTHDQVGSDTDALLTRIERLESTVKQLREAGPVSRPASAAPKDPSTGRAVLGGAARRPSAQTEPAGSSTDQTEKPSSSEPSKGSSPADPAPSEPTPRVADISVIDAWNQGVRGQLKPLVRALYTAGSFGAEIDGVWQFNVPTEAHGRKCGEHRKAVESALSAAVGSPVKLEFVVGGSGPDPTGGSPRPPQGATTSEPPAEQPAPTPPQDESDIDLDDLTDAPPESVKSPIDHLADAFPGSEMMSDD